MLRLAVALTFISACLLTVGVVAAKADKYGIALIQSTDAAARATQKCQRANGLAVTKNPRNYSKPHGRGYRREAHHRWHNRRRACQFSIVVQVRRLVDGCLHELIIREASGFRLYDPSTWWSAARKPNGQGSGAYGIPQALPGSKMASHGRDWATNPLTQIRWMLDYVRKYGGSCSALAFQKANNYY